MKSRTASTTTKKGITLTSAVEPLHTLDDLADTLRVGRRTIHRMLAAGTLPKPSLYIGKMPRWTTAAVRGWLDEQAHNN